MRFKLGGYSGQLKRVNEAFINDIANAGKLKNDAELLCTSYCCRCNFSICMINYFI